MKTLFYILMCFPILFLSCNGSGSLQQKTPEQLRQELKIREQSNIQDYLLVEYNLSTTFWTGQDVITGTINNSATVAKFKDVVLTVIFFTETDTELGTKDYVIYKFFDPNSKTDFEIETDSPSATKKIGVRVKSAVPID